MPAIRVVAEIVLNAKDLESLAEFYQHVLGFEHFDSATLADDQSPAPTIIFLKIADLPAPFGDHHPQLLVLIDPHRHTYAKGKFDPPAQRNSTLNHLAFQIDEADYDSELNRLTQLGLEPFATSFPKLRSKAIFFQDPENNTIELICHDSSE